MSHPTLGKAGAVRGGLRAGQRWDAVRAAPLVPDNAGRRERGGGDACVVNIQFGFGNFTSLFLHNV